MDRIAPPQLKSQLDPDGRLCLAVRCTANAGRIAPTACCTEYRIVYWIIT